MRGTLAGTVNDSASIPDIRSLADESRRRRRLRTRSGRGRGSPISGARGGGAGRERLRAASGARSSAAIFACDRRPFPLPVAARPRGSGAACAACRDAARRRPIAPSSQRQTDSAVCASPTASSAAMRSRAHCAATAAAHALLVALADIGGVWSVDEVTAALTEFADASVEGARRRRAVGGARRTAIKLADPDDPGAGSGFVDPGARQARRRRAQLFERHRPRRLLRLRPRRRSPRASSRRRSTPASRSELARLLQERTADGYVHRVDYRLRPDPGSTPTAVSLASAYTYYETVGQNWERAALIKARPVAGDLALGERFLADLTPFIWRKYFDFAAIADVHAMKRQIHAVRGHDEIAVAGHDIKLGRGGIREIEFFVQTQQLVFGGRRPAPARPAHPRHARRAARRGLDHGEGARRARRGLPLPAHRSSTACRWSPTSRRSACRPTPTRSSASRSSAASRPCKAFETALCAARATTCRRITRCCSRRGRSSPPRSATSSSPARPTIRRRSRRCGASASRNPELAAETVRGWHFGRRPAVTSARAREVLTELIPALLAALGGTADPDARARGSRPRLRPHAGGRRAPDHPAVARPPAPPLRRPSRHGAAARRHRGAEPARARRA